MSKVCLQEDTRTETIHLFTYKRVIYELSTPPLSLKESTIHRHTAGRWVTGTLVWHTESTFTVGILFTDAEPNGCLSPHESKQVITRRAGAALKEVWTTVRPLRSTWWHITRGTWLKQATRSRSLPTVPSQVEFWIVSHHRTKLEGTKDL